MSTYKKTGPGGYDYAVPSKHKSPCPPPEKPDWPTWCYPYPDVEPVPTPEIPGRKPPCPPPPCPPPYPFPEKIDKSSKMLSKLSQKSKVLVQMINDFKKNKPVIVTIGKNSYQFGTDKVITSDGEAAQGMYSHVVCLEETPEYTETTDYTVEDDGRVILNEGVAKDLLQTELKRVQIEIAKVAALLSEEIADDDNSISGVIGID